jgi:hypothetical protein
MAKKSNKSSKVRKPRVISRKSLKSALESLDRKPTKAKFKKLLNDIESVRKAAFESGVILSGFPVSFSSSKSSGSKPERFVANGRMVDGKFKLYSPAEFEFYRALESS